jgi:hypothetical protein
MACFGIFPHSIDRKPTHRGLVVREIDCETHHAHDARNYGGMEPIKIYRSRKAGEKAIDEQRVTSEYA